MAKNKAGKRDKNVGSRRGREARRDEKGNKEGPTEKGGKYVLNRDEGISHVNIQGTFQAEKTNMCLKPSEDQEMRKEQQRLVRARDGGARSRTAGAWPAAVDTLGLLSMSRANVEVH